MNALSFPCFFCQNELNAPIVKPINSDNNYHKQCFDKVLDIQNRVCRQKHKPIISDSKENKDLEALIEKISKFLKKSPFATPEYALYKAVQCGDLQIVKHLIESKVSFKNLINGKTLLWVALNNGHDDVAIYLLENKAPMALDYLVVACKNHMLSFLKKIQSMGKNPNWIDENNYSSLHIAAMQKDSMLLEFLLETANLELINAVDDKKKFPLLLAVKHGNTQNVKLLCDAGANLNIEYQDENILKIARDKLRRFKDKDEGKDKAFVKTIDYLEGLD